MAERLTAQSLASGSSGNALLIEAGQTVLLVDCGLGVRGLTNALAAVGRSPGELDAVLLTHEHADHASGLEAVVRRNVPVISTAGTARASALPASAWLEALPGTRLTVRNLEVSALAVSHDAAAPTGYRIAFGGRAVTVLTDLGRPDDALCDALAGSDLVVLEANHDVDLLRGGPYPAHLKRRVLSATGHLSNADCADLLVASFRTAVRPRTVWLAHLSQTNNRPALAIMTVEQRLARANLAVRLAALPRRTAGPIWDADVTPSAAAQLAMPGF